MNFLDLPYELVQLIFSFIDPKILLTLRLTNNNFQRIATEALFRNKSTLSLPYQKRFLQYEAKNTQLPSEIIFKTLSQGTFTTLDRLNGLQILAHQNNTKFKNNNKFIFKFLKENIEHRDDELRKEVNLNLAAKARILSQAEQVKILHKIIKEMNHVRDVNQVDSTTLNVILPPGSYNSRISEAKRILPKFALYIRDETLKELFRVLTKNHEQSSPPIIKIMQNGLHNVLQTILLYGNNSLIATIEPFANDANFKLPVSWVVNEAKERINREEKNNTPVYIEEQIAKVTHEKAIETEKYNAMINVAYKIRHLSNDQVKRLGSHFLQVLESGDSDHVSTVIHTLMTITENNITLDNSFAMKVFEAVIKRAQRERDLYFYQKVNEGLITNLNTDQQDLIYEILKKADQFNGFIYNQNGYANLVIDLFNILSEVCTASLADNLVLWLLNSSSHAKNEIVKEMVFDISNHLLQKISKPILISTAEEYLNRWDKADPKTRQKLMEGLKAIRFLTNQDEYRQLTMSVKQKLLAKNENELLKSDFLLLSIIENTLADEDIRQIFPVLMRLMKEPLLLRNTKKDAFPPLIVINSIAYRLTEAERMQFLNEFLANCQAMQLDILADSVPFFVNAAVNFTKPERMLLLIAPSTHEDLYRIQLQIWQTLAPYLSDDEAQRMVEYLVCILMTPQRQAITSSQQLLTSLIFLEKCNKEMLEVAIVEIEGTIAKDQENHFANQIRLNPNLQTCTLLLDWFNQIKQMDETEAAQENMSANYNRYVVDDKIRRAPLFAEFAKHQVSIEAGTFFAKKKNMNLNKIEDGSLEVAVKRIKISHNGAI